MRSGNLQKEYLKARHSDKALSCLIASEELKRFIFSVVRSTCRKYSAILIDSEEMVNIYGEVVYKLTRELVYIKKILVNFPAYVSRCSANQTIDHLRKQKMKFVDINLADHPALSKTANGKLIVEMAINKIKKEYGQKAAEIVFLRIQEKMSFREIAEFMEMKKSTVADLYKKVYSAFLRWMDFYQ